MDMSDKESPLICVVEMKNKLTLCVAVAAVMILTISVNSAIATGAESDSDDRFDNIPGAGDCWQDGYNDGQNGPFSQSRNDGCTDKRNQYYAGFVQGCKDAGNTEDVCASSTD
jgi:hypothetical protein